MYLTLDEATDRVMASHKVMLRALQSGKLAGFQMPTGEWLVSAEDLVHRYTVLSPRAPHPLFPTENSKGPASDDVDHLYEQLQAERSRVEELKVERDRWAAQAEGLTKVLSGLPSP